MLYRGVDLGAVWVRHQQAPIRNKAGVAMLRWLKLPYALVQTRQLHVAPHQPRQLAAQHHGGEDTGLIHPLIIVNHPVIVGFHHRVVVRHAVYPQRSGRGKVEVCGILLIA